MKLEFHWKQYERLRREGLTALESDERVKARGLLLSAAEHLFLVAQLSSSDLQKTRYEQATELVALTQRLRSGNAVKNREECEVEESAETLFETVERPDIGFDSVAGFDAVKEELRLRIVYPFLHQESAAQFGVSAGGGLLLFGPPGTGKTLMARAVAGEAGCSFFTVKPSDVLSKWVGDAEKNLASLFLEARRQAPAIIFLDEIDALAPSRSETSSPVMARLVPQILTELEGFDRGPDPVLFLGATNEPWSLDPALLRPGRFDRQMYLGLPDLSTLRFLLDLHLEGKPVSSILDRDRVVESWSGYTGADVRQICRRAADSAFLDSIRGEPNCSIDRERLELAAAETPRSVPSNRLAEYERYASRFATGASA